MTMIQNEYWKREEFEDLVARGLISMYENKIQKECFKVPSFIKPNEKDIIQLKSMGAYFPPNDRIVHTHEVDVINDGFPKEASFAYDPTEDYKSRKKKDLLKGEYFRLGYLRLIDKAPPGILNFKGLKYFGGHKVYKFLSFSACHETDVHIMKSYVSINQNGKVYDTFARKQDGKLQTVAHGSIDLDNESITSDIGWTTSTIGFYQDRRYLWNVTANEGIAKATFGVYPEQIKSLFYSRELPMTETGRKRPILHWVAAHQRRLKNGIDIDIEKHLRGINEFFYQGTKFVISRPMKGLSV